MTVAPWKGLATTCVSLALPRRAITFISSASCQDLPMGTAPTITFSSIFELSRLPSVANPPRLVAALPSS